MKFYLTFDDGRHCTSETRYVVSEGTWSQLHELLGRGDVLLLSFVDDGGRRVTERASSFRRAVQADDASL